MDSWVTMLALCFSLSRGIHDLGFLCIIWEIIPLCAEPKHLPLALARGPCPSASLVLFSFFWTGVPAPLNLSFVWASTWHTRLGRKCQSYGWDLLYGDWVDICLIFFLSLLFFYVGVSFCPKFMFSRFNGGLSTLSEDIFQWYSCGRMVIRAWLLLVPLRLGCTFGFTLTLQGRVKKGWKHYGDALRLNRGLTVVMRALFFLIFLSLVERVQYVFPRSLS